jgi:hypothetical protein
MSSYLDLGRANSSTPRKALPVRVGPEDIANLAAAFEAALSKLGGPRDDDSGEVDHRGAKSAGAIP